MRGIGIGVIGAGCSGRRHAAWYKNVVTSSPGLPPVTLKTIADTSAPDAAGIAKDFGFERWRVDWRWVIEDPDIHVISIADRKMMRSEVIEAAVRAGKHVHLGTMQSLPVRDANRIRRWRMPLKSRGEPVPGRTLTEIEPCARRCETSKRF